MVLSYTTIPVAPGRAANPTTLPAFSERLTRVAPPEHFSSLPPPASVLSLSVLHEGAVVLEFRENRVHFFFRLRIPHVDCLRSRAAPNFAPLSVVDDQLVICAG